MDQTSTPSYEFEGFRLDTVLQVLFAPTGEPVALPSRAFETLRYLVERSGELVEKSSLMKAVWPRAVVEENNLSQCIFTLRKVLGEAAGERRFILTVPGRGFKFVALVKVIPNAKNEPHVSADSLVRQPGPTPVEPVAAAPAAAAPPTGKRQQRLWISLAVACAAMLAIGTAKFLLNSHSPVTSSAEYEPLTDMADSSIAPALSPDGHMLAFIAGGDSFLSAGQIWLRLLPDGEPIQLTHTSGLIFAPTFTPDGAHVAYSAVDRELGGTWDTWIVPIVGGEATRLLPNASGLSFIGLHEVMYSEFKTGLHLGIVSSLDDRSQHREIYLPSHERGMAHYSYLSTDRKSVLIVEMDKTANWHCRLVPFDGSSPGSPVGPAGACRSAAWSPSGEWMYFSVQVDGHSHLWRQRYPHGAPQQITFGPTDEETVACAPDGRSLLTSLGREQSTIWLHAGGSERALTTETYASSPWLSPDAHRVYFLTARNSTDPSELWRVEVASGRKQSLLAGFPVVGYDISPDERLVIFATARGGESQIWIAPLDRHAPPSLLIRGGDEPAFDRAGDVFFRSLGEHANFLHRMKSDGSSNIRVLDSAIVEFHGVAPDGRWVSVGLPIKDGLGAAFLAPVGGGPPNMIRKGWWPSQWSRDGNVLYLEVGTGENSQRHGRTAPLPIGPDGLPTESAMSVPDALLIPHAELDLSMGSDPSVYAFVKWQARRNIYRIPLH